jgi:hypothetical protein
MNTWHVEIQLHHSWPMHKMEVKCPASRPCHITLGERTPCSHRIGVWVGPSVGLDTAICSQNVFAPVSLHSWYLYGGIECFLWGTNWTLLYYVRRNSVFKGLSFVQYSSGHNKLRNCIKCFLWGTNWTLLYYVRRNSVFKGLSFVQYSSGYNKLKNVIKCFLWSTNWTLLYYVRRN